uniref:Cytochrome c oxidase subunit 3 n=1 Tax=Heterodoxus macropus TaxID=145266 RepID=Q9B8G8_9NEOP|nr:cytochrome oxidase subunit III [Heterodoxus macropus]
MFKNGFFLFHIVDESPWPLFLSFSVFLNMLSALVYLKFHILIYMLLSNMLSILIFYMWMRDMISESTMQGMHTLKVQNGIKMGMVLFITSEVMFFFSFFWSLGYYMVSHEYILSNWPLLGIMSLNPSTVPLLGTMILLSSGVSVTWCHNELMLSEGNLSSMKNSLLITVILGMVFAALQMWEYFMSTFTMSDGVYGSLFYMMTGFHGFHVIVGTIFLFIIFLRLKNYHFSSHHHLGFQAAAWYWHFVDVVWIFLYIMLYWGSW